MSDTPNPIREFRRSNYYQPDTGAPPDYAIFNEVQHMFPINPGELNKLYIRPDVLGEHVKSSREIQSVITSSNIVGQIFKASADNINGIFLTLESAATETVIDDIEYSGVDATLQATWVKTGNILAVTESTIVSDNKSSTESMKLSMTANNDLWTFTKSSGSWDLTSATIEFDYYQTQTSDLATMELEISDGTNTSIVTIGVQTADLFQHLSVPAEVLVGSPAADVSAITKIIFKVIKNKGGTSAYVDNLRFRPAPGSIDIKLWNMGKTLPVSDSTVLSQNEQYVEIGDRSIGNIAASFRLFLQGGKRLYHPDNFIAGVAKEIPSNRILTIGNYYAITLHYVDTDVSVYGPDTSFTIQYYKNGYAFTAVDEDTTISAIGTYSDLMFGICCVQEVYIVEMRLELYDSSFVEAVPDGGTESFWIAEDENMQIIQVASFHRMVKSSHVVTTDLMNKPLKLPDGGKFKIHYNAGINDNVRQAFVLIRYMHKDIQLNQ